MLELVGDGAVEARDGEGESGQCEGKVIGFVGEGAAEGIFDAVSRGDLLVCEEVEKGTVRAYSRIVSLMIWLRQRSPLINTAHS